MEDSEINPQTPTPPEPSSPNHPCCSLPNYKCNTLLYCLAAVLILVILSGVAYLYSIQHHPSAPPVRTIQTGTTSVLTPNPADNWNTYIHKHFSFSYPKNWHVYNEVKTEIEPDYVSITRDNLTESSYGMIIINGQENGPYVTNKGFNSQVEDWVSYNNRGYSEINEVKNINVSGLIGKVYSLLIKNPESLLDGKPPFHNARWIFVPDPASTDQFYVIQLNGNDPDLEKILSTFHFLSQPAQTPSTTNIPSTWKQTTITGGQSVKISLSLPPNYQIKSLGTEQNIVIGGIDGNKESIYDYSNSIGYSACLSLTNCTSKLINTFTGGSYRKWFETKFLSDFSYLNPQIISAVQKPLGNKYYFVIRTKTQDGPNNLPMIFDNYIFVSNNIVNVFSINADLSETQFAKNIEQILSSFESIWTPPK